MKRMQIHNQTRTVCLANRARLATGFWDRLVGLLGKSSLESGQGLYLSPCQSIHSFFMRFAFDAIFVDRTGIVVHLIREMQPFRISRFVTDAYGVIEVPEKSIEKSGTRIGDQLALITSD